MENLHSIEDIDKEILQLSAVIATLESNIEVERITKKIEALKKAKEALILK